MRDIKSFPHTIREQMHNELFRDPHTNETEYLRKKSRPGFEIT